MIYNQDNLLATLTDKQTVKLLVCLKNEYPKSEFARIYAGEEGLSGDYLYSVHVKAGRSNKEMRTFAKGAAEAIKICT